MIVRAKTLNFVFFAGILLWVAFSCKPKEQGGEPIFADLEAAPSQSLFDSRVVFSDSGDLQMIMESRVLYNFEDEKKTQLFPEGIRATFYNEEKEANVLLVADSAINYQKDKLMKFYKNVVIYDYRKGDTIYTEAIYWNQNKKTLHSDVKVKQVGRYMVLEGDGFDSDERMENFVLRRPRGVFY